MTLYTKNCKMKKFNTTVKARTSFKMESDLSAITKHRLSIKNDQGVHLSKKEFNFYYLLYDGLVFIDDF